MEMTISTSKLNEIAGQAKSIYGYIIIGLGGLFVIIGAIRADLFSVQLNSLDAIWNIIKTEIVLSTGIVMIIGGYFFNRGQLLNADMYGYISKRKMKEILKSCEMVESKLVSKTTTKKVRRWFTPMTEYQFVLNNDNTLQARYGSFDNELFKDDDSPTTNIHKDEEPIACKAYWSPQHPNLVVPAFLVDE